MDFLLLVFFLKGFTRKFIDNPWPLCVRLCAVNIEEAEGMGGLM